MQSELASLSETNCPLPKFAIEMWEDNRMLRLYLEKNKIKNIICKVFLPVPLNDS